MLPPDAFPRLKIFQQCVCGHWGSLQRSPDPLAGKGGGAPGMAPTRKGGPPGRRGVGREGEGAGEGQNCCHQMSDFTAKMRGRAIILTYLHVLTSVVL